MSQGFATNGNIVITGQVNSTLSSTSPLNTGNTWTSSAVDVSVYPSVTIAVTTDQNGYYSIQFSADGTNWDSVLTRYYNTSLINPPHSFVVTRRYARVSFTNSSASNQTYFRFQTILGGQGQLNAPIDATLAQNYDAIVTRPTIAEDEIRRGLRQGASEWNKFGYRTATTAAGGDETIWATNTNFTILTTASTFTITYNNATDGLGTTGATSLLFYYLDSNFALQTAVHVLGNTGSDVTAFTGLGINRCLVYSSGTVNTNTNTITVTATTGGSTQAIIPALGSVTQQCIFHVPIGHVAVIKQQDFSMLRLGGGSDPKATIKIFAYNRLLDNTYEVFRVGLDSGVQATYSTSNPIQFSGRDVIYYTIDTDINSTVISARFTLNLYRNVDA